MATNIPIKLTGDNKSALAAISGVQKGLGTLGTGVDNLNKKMALFTNALVGAGVIAFTKSLLGAAAQLQDMSEALDINTARLLEMGVAASASGSSMEGLTSMLFRMENNIQAAVEGNGEMIDALRGVGITLKDVNTLRPDELFNKIAVALSKITNPLERTRLQTELFGKASKGFSAQSYVAEIEKLYGTMDKYTESTANAARISDSLGMFLTLVKAEFLALLQPILDILTPMTSTGNAMKAASIAAKILLGALALIIASTTINLVRSLASAFSLVAGAMGFGVVAAKAENTALAEGTALMTSRFIQQQKFYAGKVAELDITIAATRAKMAEMNSEIGLARAQAVLTESLKRRTTAAANLAGYNKALETSNLAVAATTNVVTASTNIATRAVVGLRVAITAMAVAAAAFVARLAVFAVVLLPIIVLWKAFGDVITEYAIKALNKLNDGLTWTANLLRRIAGMKPLEMKPLIAPAPFYPTPDGKPIPFGATDAGGAGGGGDDFEKTTQKDAQASLAASLKLMQQQADYARQRNVDMKKGVAFADLELDIKKAIDAAEAQALKAKLNKNVVDKEGIRLALTDEALSKVQLDLDNLDLKAQTELKGINIQNTAQKEIQAELDRVRQQYGVLINENQLKNYETTLQTVAATKELNAVLQGIERIQGKISQASTAENVLAGVALAQTDSEKIQATYDLQKAQLDEAVKYAINKKGETAISEQQYADAIQRIQLQQYNAELDLVIRNFEAKRQMRAREIQAEASAQAERLMMEKDFMGQQLFTYDEAMEAATRKVEWEKKSDLQKTQSIIQNGADMFNALGAQNKKAFEMAKAFNIANAIMNTFLGATKAFAQGGIFGFLQGAAIIAAGMAQVAQIRAQTYSGRALGGPVVGGQTYMVGEKGPETFTPTSAGTITPNNQLGGGTTNITFNIVANDTKGFDQLLVERRPLITKIIRDAQLEQGRRQI